MPELSGSAIRALVLDSLFKDEELPTDGSPPPNAVLVEGITQNFGLHPGRLESHRQEVADFLAELPAKFKDGAPFVEMCDDRNGRQWTSFHRDMEALMVLGLGLKLLFLPFDRLAWGLCPGGLPFVKVL